MARSKRSRPLTPNEKEYRRIRSNILARMRYREKQGFKVDYTTRPVLKDKVTKRDIEALKKINVGLNRHGEIVAQKPTRKTNVTMPTKEELNQARIERQKMMESQQGKQYDNFVKRKTEPKQLDIDYIGMVYSQLGKLRDRAQMVTTDEIFVFNAVLMADLLNDTMETMFELVDQEVARVGEARANEYYKQRLEDITLCISHMCQMIYPDEVQETADSILRDLLIVS